MSVVYEPPCGICYITWTLKLWWLGFSSIFKPSLFFLLVPQIAWQPPCSGMVLDSKAIAWQLFSRWYKLHSDFCPTRGHLSCLFLDSLPDGNFGKGLPEFHWQPEPSVLRQGLWCIVYGSNYGARFLSSHDTFSYGQSWGGQHNECLHFQCPGNP